MTRYLALSALFLIVFNAAYSRSFPGYYVTKTGDTVQCEFRFNDWRITPDSVIAYSGSAQLTLVPSSILGFGIDGYGDYISTEITYHKADYTTIEAPDTFSDSVTTKQSFLKILVRGRYSLFQLNEHVRSYFFLRENNDKITELVYRVRRTQMDIEQDNAYKKTLFDLFAKDYVSHKYVNEISKGSYNSKTISALVSKLNGTRSRQQNSRHVSKRLAELDLFIGGIHNEFPTTFNGFYTSANKVSGSSSVSGGVNFVYHMSSHFKRFAIGLSAGYNQYDYSFAKTDSAVSYQSDNWHSTTRYTESGRMANKVIVANLYGMYFFNPLSKVRLYAKGGFSSNISISGDNDIYVDYYGETNGVRNGNVPITGTTQGTASIEMKGAYYNLNGSIGLNAGNHKLEFTYYTPGVMNSNLLFKIKMMSVYYYLTIVK